MDTRRLVDQVGASALDPKDFLLLEDADGLALGEADFLPLEEADDEQVAPRTEALPQPVPRLVG